MEIKYNRFALLPHTCSQCGKSFWLEPYKHYKITEYRIMGVIDNVFNACMECSDSINALKGGENEQTN